MGQFSEAPDIQSNTDLGVVGYFVDKKSVIPKSEFQWLGLCFHCRSHRVQSPVGEQRSWMPCSTAKKKMLDCIFYNLSEPYSVSKDLRTELRGFQGDISAEDWSFCLKVLTSPSCHPVLQISDSVPAPTFVWVNSLMYIFFVCFIFFSCKLFILHWGIAN